MGLGKDLLFLGVEILALVLGNANSRPIKTVFALF